MNLRNVISITRKELKGYFDGPTAYIVLVVFLLLWEYLFFRSAFLVGEASLRILFDILPWLLIFLVPAVTMGSISQERGEGTLEFLLTHPLRDHELLAGKFLAAMIFTAIALLFVFPLAASFEIFGEPDWGVVLGQYLGGLFMAAVLVSLGIFVSSLFRSQIASLMTGVALAFFLVIMGFEFVTASLPMTLASLFERLSLLSHFSSTARGVLDLRDLWYYLSAAAVFLGLAYLQLMRRRFGNRRSVYRSYRLGVALFIGIAVLTNVVGARIPGRVDLTRDRIYTLGDATRRVLSGLDDVVNITLFASDRLPAQLKPVLREVKDTLRDYETLGRGNVVVSVKDPGKDPRAAGEAAAMGVSEVRFNVIGEGEFKVKTGYLGLAVSYAGESEAIPFIEDTSDLEYQLTSFIRQLTVKEKPKIAFLAGHGEKNLYSDYRIFSGELDKQFQVETVSLDEEGSTLPEGTRVVVVAGPTQRIGEEARSAVRDFLSRGGSALFLIDTVKVSPGTLTAYPNRESFADFLHPYGVTVEEDIVYDLRANETVRFGGGVVSYLLPYPFWARVFGVEDSTSPIARRVGSILLPWAATVDLDTERLKEKGLDAEVLLTTSGFGGRQVGSFSISPGGAPPGEALGEQVMAVSLSDRQRGTRIVVVGDSDFLLDRFTRNTPENIVFGLEALSWLGQEDSIAGLRIKQRVRRKLLFQSPVQAAMVKYGNMAAAVLVPAGFGALRLIRRRRLRRFSYGERS